MSIETVRGVDRMAATRVSFLEQAAVLLAQKSALRNDIYKKMSATCAKELREFSYVEQIRPSTEIKRSICKRCKVSLVSDRNGNSAIAIRRHGRQLQRRCLNCDHKVNYVCNANYRSRNEKADKTTHTPEFYKHSE
ncbi:hypothetical protein M3Y96_00027900 [Aphelenchoides besseyi]|nr:hypothetical protein M3Y96_00027900 [Aphelenchoides besseyi]